jgi:epoxyqueuosine reductase QueG
MAKKALATPDIARIVITFMYLNPAKDLLAMYLATKGEPYIHRLRLALQSLYRITVARQTAGQQMIDNIRESLREQREYCQATCRESPREDIRHRTRFYGNAVLALLEEDLDDEVTDSDVEARREWERRMDEREAAREGRN